MRVGNTQPPLGTPLNKSHPLSRGLLSYYPMNEGGGQKSFDIIYNRPGTLTNGAIFTQNAKGQCISFNGTNSYIDTLSTLLNGVPTASFSFWMYYKGDISSSAVDGIIANWKAGQLQVLIRISASNMQFFTNTTIGFVGGNTGYTVTNNVWTFFAFTYDGATMKSYKNGVVSATTAAQTGVIATTANTIKIGGGNAGGGGSEGDYNGYVNNVMIYSRSLLANEAMQLYINQYQMFQGYRGLKK